MCLIGNVNQLHGWDFRWNAHQASFFLPCHLPSVENPVDDHVKQGDPGRYVDHLRPNGGSVSPRADSMQQREQV
jgi:hypothetical protein